MLNSENYVVIQGWMCNELQLKGNELLVYALIYGFSQDGESVFSGGRNYIAKTFNISLPTVDKALNNLVSRELIEKITRNINGVVFNDYKISLGVVKKFYGGGKETLPNNINNNKNNNGISKDIPSERPSEFQFGVKPTKPGLYQNCIAMIYDFTEDEKLRGLLIQYLDLCLEMKTLLGKNQWKGMLNTLDRAYNESTTKSYGMIVQRSIEHGWKTFYPIDDKFNNSSGSNIEQLTGLKNGPKYVDEDHSSSGKEF